MKIDYNLPIKLPKECLVTYGVISTWRLGDGIKITEGIILELEFFGEGYTLENIYPIFEAIKKANPTVYKATLSTADDLEPVFVMTFNKDSKSAKQNPDDLEDIQYPPQDPIEWPVDKGIQAKGE